MAARMEWVGFAKIAPGVNDALLALSKAIQQSGLDSSLLELVKVRASLINGCAFCIQYHSTNALTLGVTNDQLMLLSAWGDVPVYSERERAALRWTDVLTKVQSAEDVGDFEYSSVREQFSDVELANLTGAIALINAWNRIAKAYRFSPPIATRSNQE